MKDMRSTLGTNQIYNDHTLSFQFIIRIIGTFMGLVLVNLSSYQNNMFLVYGVASLFILVSGIARFTNIKNNLLLQKLNLYIDVFTISILIIFRGGMRSDFFLGYYIILGYVLLLRDSRLLFRITLWILISFTIVSVVFTPVDQFSLGRLMIRETLLMGTVYCLYNYSKLLTQETSLRIRASELALKDNLTKVYNRNILMNVDEMLLPNTTRVSVVLLDIDDFKKVNDTYGHLYGDEVLVAFGSILNVLMPSEDLIIRYGGEEFLLLIQDLTDKQVYLLLDDIQKEFNQKTFPWYDSNVQFSFSAGSVQKNVEESFSAGIDRADKKLYQAKSEGKNRIIM